MTIILILGLGVVLGALLAKLSNAKERITMDQHSNIKVTIIERRVYVEGSVVDVTVNNKKMIEYKGEKH